jgi:hypothetical protein
VIDDLREIFNESFSAERYLALLNQLEVGAGAKIEFRVAETPVFLPEAMLEEMANAGASLLRQLMAWPEYMESARTAIPEGYLVGGNTGHPHFLTADFALVNEGDKGFAPRLVEIQAFPSVFAYQVLLNETYRKVFTLPESLRVFFGEMTQTEFWDVFRKTVLGEHAPENSIRKHFQIF